MVNQARAKDPEYGHRLIDKGQTLTLAAQVLSERLWPTPRSCSAMAAENIGNRVADKFPNLESEVARSLWPTPTTRDYKGGRRPETLEASGRGATNNLNDALTCQGRHGSLNPTWVEWLMGFPEGWTDLKPSEMPSSRKSQK